MTCFNCNGSGHVSRQCPSPKSAPQPQVNGVKTEILIPQAWTVDSRANYHLVANQENIAHPLLVLDTVSLTIVDGNTLHIHSHGSSSSLINCRSFIFNDVLYSLAVQNNLLSISTFSTQNNVSIVLFLTLIL